MQNILNKLRKIDFQSEKFKDFLTGGIALFFLVAAGWIAMDRFESPVNQELGTGGENGEITTGEITGSGSTQRDETINNGQVEGTTQTRWVANDYVKGDISSGNYTVIDGDTLWEIAEAVYGDGTMWTKILDANKSDVGFLPNGSQALIVVGQTLVLP